MEGLPGPLLKHWSKDPELARAEVQRTLKGSSFNQEEFRAAMERAKNRGWIQDAQRGKYHYKDL